MKNRPGFTVVEILVVLAIVTLLLSVLLPAASTARETARQTYCSGNLSQIDKAVSAYASDNHDMILPGATRNPNVAGQMRENWVSISVATGYLQTKNPQSSSDLPIASTVFECPSGKFDATTTLSPSSQTDANAYRPWRLQSSSLAAGTYFETNYGVNGATSSTFNQFAYSPFHRTPDDNDSSNSSLVTLSSIHHPFKMVGLFDGVFMNLWANPNRLHARHFNNTLINIAYFDGHVAALNTKLRSFSQSDYGSSTSMSANYPTADWHLDQ